jgi:hypothetical protein
MTTIHLHTLPTQLRVVLAEAERTSRLAYANAINHESPDYDAAAERAHDCYTDLCEQTAVCCKYGCFERTNDAQYCPMHAITEVR